MNARAWPALASLFLVAFSAAAGCSRPKLLECKVPCTMQSGCPQGLSCQNGFCAAASLCATAPDAGSTDDGPADSAADALADSPTDDGPGLGSDSADTDGTAAEADDISDGEPPGDDQRDERAEPAAVLPEVRPETAGDGDPADGAGTGARQPAQIPGLVLWLDAADLPVGSLGAWPDKSGQGHAGSPRPDGQAQVVVDVQTQRPVVDMSTATDYVTMAGTFIDFTAGMTMVVVLYPRVSYMPSLEYAIYTHLIDFGVFGTNSNSIQLQRAGRGEAQLELFTFLDGDTNTGLRAPESIGNYSWQIFTGVVGGGQPGASTAAALYKNGARLTQANTFVPNLVTRPSNLLGAANFRYQGLETVGHYRGRIAEVLTYARALTDDERVGLERYLSDKWRIALGR